MTQIDPYKVTRNTATLEAYRSHHKAVRAAAQPWLTIALAAVAIEFSLFLFELFHSALRDLGLVSSGLILVFGLSFGIAALRAWLFSRAHPLELPEPPRPTWR